MPAFPGMGYPLVPGYESVGRVVAAGAEVQDRIGDTVFVPGANCYTDARGLFGGASRTVILPAAKALAIDPALGRHGALLALAATAHHALAAGRPADLIVGHGVLGRLLARITVALGGAPTVWESNAARTGGATGYAVTDAASDDRRDYASIYDVSGAPDMLDPLVAPAGARRRDRARRLLRPPQLHLPAGVHARGALPHRRRVQARRPRRRHRAAWRGQPVARWPDHPRLARRRRQRRVHHRAFGDAACLKMVLDWSDVA